MFNQLIYTVRIYLYNQEKKNKEKDNIRYMSQQYLEKELRLFVVFLNLNYSSLLRDKLQSVSQDIQRKSLNEKNF